MASEPRSLSRAAALQYAAGYVGISATEGVVATWVWVVYRGGAARPALGTFAAVGVAAFIARIVDSLADPVVAHYSDGCRSPLGRRIPFLRWAALPTVLAMFMLFTPPGHGVSTANVVYLACVLSAFYAAFTAYAGPYLALLPQLATTQSQRLAVSSYQAVGSLAGTAIGTVVSPLLVASIGDKAMAGVLGMVSLAFLWTPAFCIVEARVPSGGESTASMVRSLVETLRTKPFARYLAANLGFWFGFNMVRSQLVLFVTELVGQGEGHAATYMGLVFGVCVVCLPAALGLARRFGNRRAMLAFMAMDAILLPLLYFVDSPSTMAGRAALCYTIMGLAGIPLAGLFVVPNAIVADLTDYDERLTGKRREAMFFAAQGFFGTASLGLSALLVALLQSLSGPTMGLKLSGPVAGFFILGATACMLRYPEAEVTGRARA